MFFWIGGVLIKKLLKKLLNRNFLITVILLIQVVFIVSLLLSVYDDVSAIYSLQWIISIITVCYVVNRKNTNPAYKLVWSILIMSVPLFGVFMYLFLHVQFGTMKFNNKKNQLISLTKPLMPQDKQVMRELEEDSVYMAHLAQYVNNFGRYPVYKNTQIDYYKIGEEKYESLIRELQKAKKFIFMEYFIIDLGEVWNTILKILEQKVDEGVEVRLLYDGMGSQLILPQYYNTYLETKGIKCRVFNEYRPFLSTLQNNRDHRKIVVIDGKVAFNGGVNLADEYINEVSRFGHWKDTAVMIKGDAVRSYTVMFIQMWERKTRQLSEYERYKTKYLDVPEKGEIRADGFVLPYGDSPTRNEYIAKHIYLDIINKAKKYVHIITPYLVIDNEIVTALSYAAKSGVKVRIIVPHIPDKWYVNFVSWSYYKELIKQGVNIYEYMPGFIHAKNFISDDEVAVVGTVNLDYRSLYLHFECGTLMYKTPVISEIQDDFMETLVKCRRITLKDCYNRPVLKKLIGSVFRMLAPLL